MSSWRLYWDQVRRQEWDYLLDPERSGEENMELDSRLLREAQKPTLRLYSWVRPTISLGYGQRDGWIDRSLCAELGVDVVRRPTGGRALLHLPGEITYAVVLPDISWSDGSGQKHTLSVREAFGGIAGTLALALQNVGLPVSVASEGRIPGSAAHPSCLKVTAPGEVTARGKKLIGSAQCRVGSRLLQHGAMLRLRNNDLLGRVIPGAKADVDLAELGFSDLSPEDIAKAWQGLLGEAQADNG